MANELLNLQKQRDQLDARIRAMQADEAKKKLDIVIELVKKYQFTPTQIFGSAGKPPAPAPVARTPAAKKAARKTRTPSSAQSVAVASTVGDKPALTPAPVNPVASTAAVPRAAAVQRAPKVVKPLRAPKAPKAQKAVKPAVAPKAPKAPKAAKAPKVAKPPKAAGRPTISAEAKAPVLYRDPETGLEWAGRGAIPSWIAGKDREQFLVG